MRDRDFERVPRRRRNLLLAMVTLALIATFAAVASSRYIKSPRQVAAETAPPKPSVLTASVQNRELADFVLLRGEVKRGKTEQLTPGEPPDGARSVVTGVGTRRGDDIKAGQVVLEVAGRPAFALDGSIPLYRDIQPGVTGPDVEQLQGSLRGLGYYVSDGFGVYGASTQAAVTALYRDSGYEPLTMTEETEEVEASPEDETKGSKARKPAPPPRELPVVPQSEFLYVKRLPAKVTAVNAAVGQEVKAPAIVIGISPPVITAHVNPADARQIRVGQTASMSAEGRPQDMRGRVTGKGKPVSTEQDGLVVPVSITPLRPLAASLIGQQFAVRVLTKRTGRSLVVPLAAVTSQADGRTIVTKVTASGDTQVEVAPGLSADGYVQVVVRQATDLIAGDRVVVGYS